MLGLVGFILTITVVVLAVRWSLAIPAILAEDLTFGEASRGAPS